MLQVGMQQFVQQAGILQPRPRRGEAIADHGAPRFGQLSYHFPDAAGFDLGDGDKLPATGAAALLAGDLLSLSLGGLHGGAHHSIHDGLHHGQQDFEMRRTGRHGQIPESQVVRA